MRQCPFTPLMLISVTRQLLSVASPYTHIQIKNIVYLVDGWRMLWPRSWGFWLWVLIASERRAGVICCTSALLLKFLRLPVRSVWGERTQKHHVNKTTFIQAPIFHYSKTTFKTYLSISFCTSSMCSIASCCSFSERKRNISNLGFWERNHEMPLKIN